MNAKSKGLGWQDGSVVRAWAVLAQDPGSVPSGHVVSQDIYNSSFRASAVAPSLQFTRHSLCTDIQGSQHLWNKQNLLVFHRIYIVKFEIVKMAKKLKILLDSYINLKQISLKPEILQVIYDSKANSFKEFSLSRRQIRSSVNSRREKPLT